MKFIIMIVVYLLLGIVAEVVEEIIIGHNAKKWFDLPEDIEVSKKFTDRFKDYNREEFLRDIAEILSWPIGLVYWICGIRKGKNGEIDWDQYKDN